MRSLLCTCCSYAHVQCCSSAHVHVHVHAVVLQVTGLLGAIRNGSRCSRKCVVPLQVLPFVLMDHYIKRVDCCLLRGGGGGLKGKGEREGRG